MKWHDDKLFSDDTSALFSEPWSTGSLVELFLFLFSVVCYGAEECLHTTGPLTSSRPCGPPVTGNPRNGHYFSLPTINHTIQCLRRIAVCGRAVRRVSATWMEDIWINERDSRLRPFVVLTGLYMAGILWQRCLDIPFHVFPLYL